MPIQRIDEVRPGSVLARPVEDSMGRTLINVGEVLTEELIAVLRRRGFAEVEIKPLSAIPGGLDTDQLRKHHRSSTDSGSTLKEEISDTKARVRSRFEGVRESNHPMQTLRKAVESVMVERLLAKRGRK